MTEAGVMIVQMLLGGVGGAFMLGCAWMALKARISANSTEIDSMQQALKDHESGCEERYKALWQKIDKVSDSLARIETTLSHMKENRNA